ncbi:MAG: spermidine synthase [Gemmatimonadaceae bacterium]
MNQSQVPAGQRDTRHSGGIELGRASALRLAGYAFLILFLELALIRYVSAYVRVFGFYMNMVLIATFLGMGVGVLRARAAQRLRWFFLPALPLLLGAVLFFSNSIIRPRSDPDESLWGVFFELGPNVRQVALTPTVIVLFALCTIVMLPLGALLGREFARWKPLQAYSLDIAGSLAGIAAFALMSAARTPPVFWFAVVYGIWFVLSLDRKRYAMAVALTAAPALALVVSTAGPKPEFWSPYYRINVIKKSPEQHSVHVNGSMHQWVLDLDAAGKSRLIGQVRESYYRPLRLAQRLDTVLIVGSGTGNDVANLLALGAKHIDAVEIDPVILEIGRVLHPQQPYSDPRVRSIVNDARAFLRHTTRHYDLIVFGTLDSQTLLSGMSSIRLDNYVYTVESFRAARARLAPNGMLVTYHMSPEPYIARKIEDMITEAFGKRPVVYRNTDQDYLFNYTYLAGGPADRMVVESPLHGVAAATLPSDDWPYLYLRKRTVPMHYLLVLGGVLGTAFLFLRFGAPRAVWKRPDAEMFFLGAGFLLLETKSVTEMSMLFGSTWKVNLLVFSAILVCVLIANAFVGRRIPSVRACFFGLFFSLAAAFALPPRSFLFLGDVGQWLIGGIFVALPIFFAGTIFASLLKQRPDPVSALGFNLVGAIVGGVLEYLSMVTGTKGLYLLAAVIYGAAYWAHQRSVARAAEAPVQSGELEAAPEAA